MGSFRLRDHTADVAVEAEADSLGEVFAAVADGMAAAMTEGDIPEMGDEFEFSETAESLQATLYDYLDRLIYERDVRGVLPVDNRATVKRVDGTPEEDDETPKNKPAIHDETPNNEPANDGGAWRVDGNARGVPLGNVDARDLKAVTYSDMVIEERADGWYAYVVFDV